MTDGYRTHDAQRTLAAVRDDLTRHAKPIAFFFGAGTSCAMRIPSAVDETKTEALIPAVAGLTWIAKQYAAAKGDR